MNIKNLLISAAAIAICAAVMTGCSGGGTSSSDSGLMPSGSETSAESSIAESSSAVDSSSAMEGESSSESGTEMGADKLSAAGDALEAAVEWPSLMLVEDTDRLKDFFLIDAANPDYKAVYAKEPMMSAAFGQYIIIEAQEGKVDEAVKNLEERRTKLIEQDSFYPEHKDLAAETVVGKTGNYAYLIACENAKDLETTLVDALK